MINAKRLLALSNGGFIYVLMTGSLMISIGCSYAAAMVYARPQMDVLEKLLMATSLVSFASIGCLSVVADCFAPAKARTVALTAPLAESHSDRPIVGLRVWRAIDCGDGGFVLQSWYAEHALWPCGREITAEPGSPGIHAFRSASALLAYAGQDITSASTVVGTVALWGVVIEHEGGWTAEKAYPLQIHSANPDQAASLRRSYGCETTWAKDGLEKALTRLDARLLDAESPSV